MLHENLTALAAKYKDKLDKFWVYEKEKHINLSAIVVKKEFRNQGIGSKVMKDLCGYADSVQKIITLTPDSAYGGNVARLKSFYKSFGFVENKGKKKDYEISDTMYRLPLGGVAEHSSIYRRGTVMKVKELKGLIREAVKKTLLEAGYDQYGEGFYSMEEDDTALMEALYEKHVGFKNLVKKLQGQGKSEKSAKAIAYSIGKKKYGKEKMAKAAASGKALSDKQALDEITQSLMSAGPTEEDLARKIAQYIVDGANGMKAVVTALSRNKGFDDLLPTLDIEGIKQMMLSYDDLRPSPREVEEAIGILQSFKEEGLDEGSLAEAPPEGWHGTVRAMKTHGHTGKSPGKIDNPYALAHYMANKGDEPHYREQPSSKRGTPHKKKDE